MVANDSDVDDDPECTEKVCRYCLEGGEMISPCACSGGQKWVHFECLLRWQSALCGDQPVVSTFPYQDDRLDVCEVCLQSYTREAPTRLDLMKFFTGPEVADMIDTGCLIAPHHDFIEVPMPLSDVQHLPLPLLHAMAGRAAAYLVVDVSSDFEQEFTFERQEELIAFRKLLPSDLELKERGRTWVLTNKGSLADIDTTDKSVARLRKGLQRLSAPAKVVLQCRAREHDQGSDLISAVNLTQPISRPLGLRQLAAEEAAKTRFAFATGVQSWAHILHFIGGPYDQHKLQWCIVHLGATYAATKNLDQALKLAHDFARFTVGQQVRIVKLRSRPDLNGARATILQFLDGQWLVQVVGRDDKYIVPAESLVGSRHGERYVRLPVRVLVFWGDARWSRVEVLDEVSRGIWGLCEAQRSDMQQFPGKLWDTCRDRLVFVPPSSRTEPRIGRIRDSDEQLTGEHMQSDESLQRQASAQREAPRRESVDVLHPCANQAIDQGTQRLADPHHDTPPPWALIDPLMFAYGITCRAPHRGACCCFCAGLPLSLPLFGTFQLFWLVFCCYCVGNGIVTSEGEVSYQYLISVLTTGMLTVAPICVVCYGCHDCQFVKSVQAYCWSLLYIFCLGPVVLLAAGVLNLVLSGRL